MATTVSVTVPDTSILSEVARAVRRQFPGASFNEILRYCGLALAYGTREAEKQVFGCNENTETPNETRVYGKIPDEEKEKLQEYLQSVPEITSISDLYRAGMYLMAGDTHTDALKNARVTQGRPKSVSKSTGQTS